MLNEKTMNEASILAKDLTAKEITLEVLKDSPLFYLCTKSMPLKKVFASTAEIYDAVIKASGMKVMDGTEPHSLALNQFTWGLSETIQTNLSIARNDVNPMINDCLEIIDDRLNGSLHRDVGILITPIFMPEIMKKGDLDDLIDRYKNSNYSEVSWKKDAWPVMTAEGLKEAAKGKNRSIDKQVDDLIKDLDDDLIVAIYDFIFRATPLPEDYRDIDEIYIHILGFLWSSTWHINILEGVNLSLNELSLNLVNLKSSSAKKIYMRMQSYERMMKQNIFIIKAPNMKVSDRKFIVQGEIYNKWISEGGSPELLIGSFLAGKLGSLNDLSEEETKEYMRRYRLDKNLRRQEFDSRKASIITRCVSDYVDENIEGLEVNRSVVRDRFNTKVKNYPYNEKIDLAFWIRKVICHTFFPESDSLKILNNIDNILKDNEDMSVREAATLATIDLITDWMFSNVLVERKP